jgi:hypothetical protein
MHVKFTEYVRKYLLTFPELDKKDFPVFDEFDFEPDGTITFSEWQRFLLKQKLLDAEKKKSEEGRSSNQIGGSQDSSKKPLQIKAK